MAFGCGLPELGLHDHNHPVKERSTALPWFSGLAVQQPRFTSLESLLMDSPSSSGLQVQDNCSSRLNHVVSTTKNQAAFGHHGYELQQGPGQPGFQQLEVRALQEAGMSSKLALD